MGTGIGRGDPGGLEAVDEVPVCVFSRRKARLVELDFESDGYSAPMRFLLCLSPEICDCESLK